MTRLPLLRAAIRAGLALWTAMATASCDPDRPATPQGPRLVSRGTLDVPSIAPEIVAITADHRVFVHIDAVQRSLELYRPQFPPQGKVSLSPVDLDSARAGSRGVKFEFEPTSVAVHPSGEVALVTEIGADGGSRGHVHAIDLREASVGRRLWSTTVGQHPDSIAISPDGRRAVIANEGEVGADAEDAVGSVSVLTWASIVEGSGLQHTELDVHEGFSKRAQACEPEYVAIDPHGRFALVTLQENDGAVAIDLRGDEPKTIGAGVGLPEGAEPDGCAVLAGFVDPTLGPGCLVAFAEEGRQAKSGEWLGQSASFYWFGPEAEFARFEFLARVDVAALLARPREDVSPESVVLFRENDRCFAAVGVERDDSVLLIEVTDARAPVVRSRTAVGVRPEGLATFRHGGRRWVVSGDEGKQGPGQVSFLEFVFGP